MIHPLSCRTGATLLLACGCAALAHAAPAYHLVDLGAGYFATAINDDDVVAGMDSQPRAVTWSQGVWQVRPGQGLSGIDDQGDAVGAPARGAAPGVLLLPADGHKRTLTVDFSVENYGSSKIADDGSVVGSVGVFAHVGTRSLCVRWAPGHKLGSKISGERCRPYGVNADGAIAGSIYPKGQPSQAFVWSAGTFQYFTVDHGYAAGATGVNLAGHASLVANYKQADGSYQSHAAFFDGHSVIDLGMAAGASYSSAVGVNDADEVVGASSAYDPQLEIIPFIYSGGQVYPLDGLIDNLGSWYNLSPVAINGHGTIIGSALLDGVQHAILLQRTGG